MNFSADSCKYSTNYHFDFSIVTIYPNTSNDAVQELVTFSLVTVLQGLTDLHSVVFLFLSEHLPGTSFAISQGCQKHFQCIETDL